jgi:hypothetical protein
MPAWPLQWLRAYYGVPFTVLSLFGVIVKAQHASGGEPMTVEASTAVNLAGRSANAGVLFSAALITATVSPFFGIALTPAYPAIIPGSPSSCCWARRMSWRPSTC